MAPQNPNSLQHTLRSESLCVHVRAEFFAYIEGTLFPRGISPGSAYWQVSRVKGSPRIDHTHIQLLHRIGNHSHYHTMWDLWTTQHNEESADFNCVPSPHSPVSPPLKLPLHYKPPISHTLAKIILLLRFLTSKHQSYKGCPFYMHTDHVYTWYNLHRRQDLYSPRYFEGLLKHCFSYCPEALFGLREPEDR